MSDKKVQHAMLRYVFKDSFSGDIVLQAMDGEFNIWVASTTNLATGPEQNLAIMWETIGHLSKFGWEAFPLPEVGGLPQYLLKRRASLVQGRFERCPGVQEIIDEHFCPTNYNSYVRSAKKLQPSLDA